MPKLAKLAIVATCTLAALFFVFRSVGSVLTNEGDYPVWQPPFSERVILVPDWMFSASVLAGIAGPLIVLLLWCAVALRKWKERKR